MRTIDSPSTASAWPGSPLDEEALQRVLQLVPSLDIRCDGNFAQAVGLDLPIVAISLAHRTDKWQALLRRLSAVGLTRIARAPAIEGARLPASRVAPLLRSAADATNGGPHSHLTLTPPAIGCFLSHLAVLRWLLRSRLPRLLVLEDDAMPAAPFDADRFCGLLAGLHEEAGFALLGCTVMSGLAERPRDGAALARVYYFNGTHAYLITPAACRTLLRHLLPMHAHLDHQISQVLMGRRHAFAAYYATPRFFDPDWSLGSDIYVPLSDATAADRELGEIIATGRRTLLAEGRPLLSELNL
jgi:hypothetical protein